MVTVIVPSYNVAPYLRRCVKSLVCQTYSDLEIILVDDGSTDDTGKICDELEREDIRIRVIHKQNGGLSDARNAGIAMATGDYYSFIDGDDYIEADTYQCMVAEMADPRVSIVEAGIIHTDVNGDTNVAVAEERKYYTKEEAFINLFGLNSAISQSSCNKLFRSGLFQNVRYKKGIFNEDMEILPRLLDVSEGVLLLDKAVYHYIKKEGSITSSDYSLQRYKAIKIERDIYLMCKVKYPKLQPYASFYELKSLDGMLRNLAGCNNCRDFKLQELNIRRKMIGVYLRCNGWKKIRDLYGQQMKVYFLTALFGVRGLEKMVRLKDKLLGKEK